MNDCITTTKQSTTKPCAYFLGYTVSIKKHVFIHTLFFLDNMYMVRFYRHEAMKCCYITVVGILCIQLVISFIACRMLSHFMYFVRNHEIKIFNQSIINLIFSNNASNYNIKTSEQIMWNQVRILRLPIYIYMGKVPKQLETNRKKTG